VRNGDADGEPTLCALGDMVVDMLPAPSAGAGPEGTTPRAGLDAARAAR
jgi:hypothetical protein